MKHLIIGTVGALIILLSGNRFFDDDPKWFIGMVILMFLIGVILAKKSIKEKITSAIGISIGSCIFAIAAYYFHYI